MTSLKAESAWSSILYSVLTWLGAGTAVYLAGGPQEGGSGIFFLAAGLAMICCPPKAAVEGRLWMALGALLFFACLALLPLRWFPAQEWRNHLGEYSISLGGQLTPVPVETTFYWAMLAISGIICLCGLAHPLRSRTLLMIAVAVVAICAGYAAMALFARQTGWNYPFASTATFGFFPNRNHTATFLITGSMLALGVLGVSANKRMWVCALLAVIGLSTCSVALLLYSSSRGGVIFLVAGTIMWLLGLGKSRWSRPVMISFTGIFLAVIILFYVSGGEARNRILGNLHTHSRPDADNRDLTLDARIPIFRDTWRMIQDQPWTGVGLGAFRYVFFHYGRESLTESAAIHPENDWLLFAAEAGVPSLLCAVAAGFLMLRRVRFKREDPSWPLRWGMICGALAAMLHGLVDVPAHRLGLGWWILLLATGGCQVFPAKEDGCPFWQRSIFLGTGVVALCLGSFLVAAEWYGRPSSPPFAGARAEKVILALFKKDQLETAVEVASAAIKQSPMAHELYFQQGVLKLNFDDTEAEVDKLFAAQRALNPSWSQIPLQQGISWIKIDPERTASLWQNALERRRRIDQTQKSGNGGVLALFGDLLSRSADYPDVQQRLLEANRHDLPLILLWLERVEKGLAAGEVARFAEDAGFIEKLGAVDRKRFLKVWYEKGDGDALFTFLDQHHDWEKEGWAFRIRRLVDARRFEEAVAAVVARHPVNLDLRSTVAALKPASESEDPLARFAFYWKAGNEITARRILEEATAQAEKVKVSPDLWRVTAIFAIQEGRWEAAWRGLRRYLVESGVDELP